MNRTKRNIGIIILILYNSVCYAQQIEPTPEQWLIEHKKEIGSTPYIFEGKIIQQKNFQWRDRLLKCNVTQITKIYKGSPKIKLGTIKIIQWDGQTKNDDMISNTADYYGVTLSKDSNYIIFGVPAYSNALDSLITDNETNLTAVVGPVRLSGATAYWDEIQYKTLDSLYSFFKENGVTVQEKVK